MNTFVTDLQAVAETEAVLFEMIQQGPVDANLTIKNDGTNTMNYRVQEHNGIAWSDLGASGSLYYNTLMSGQVRNLQVVSAYPRVRMVGNASGGAILNFSVVRYVNRTSGGTIPMLSL